MGFSSRRSHEFEQNIFLKSSKSLPGNPKAFTHGFEPATIETFDALIGIANRYSISASKYKDGHRAAANIIAGGNIILIDCDAPGQAEAVESKIRPYDYIKVPSASNCEETPYKWHFFIPTQTPLSVSPAAMKFQVEQFFQQVGITNDMIDTTGSYDIARQFAPASIKMDPDEADDLSEINETDLQVPIVDAPEELCNNASKSVTANIKGVITEKLPVSHLWYKGKAIAYADAITAVEEAYRTRESDDDKVRVSGFGCPHDNHDHTGDRTRGYGFAFIAEDGSVVIKCTGNSCKDHPYSVVPRFAPIVFKKVKKYNKSKAPKLVLSFEKHWIDNLHNVSSPALLQNWENNFKAFDEIIDRNKSAKPSKKICCPSPTGSGKTQQVIHKAISLYGSDVASLIVVMRTEDADLIAEQIAESSSFDYVSVYHSKEVSKKGVKNRYDAQCLVITHEMFKRHQDTLTQGRDLIVIDEAIDVITHYQIDMQDIEQMIKIVETKQKLNYAGRKDEVLQSEARILYDILNIQFKAMKQSSKTFVGTRPNPVAEEDSILKTLQFKQIKKLLEDPSVKPSSILTGHYNDNIDNAIKKKLIDICDNIKYFFSQFAFLTKNGYQVAWSTAKELIPDKSVVVMDATAAVNKAYEFYSRYQPEKLEVLTPIECRDYITVILHTARTNTGRSTILAKELSKSDKEKHKSVKTIIDMVMKDTKAGDDILIVTFKELEPMLETFINAIDDRKIRVDIGVT